MLLFFPKNKQSGQALKKRLAGLFLFSVYAFLLSAVLCTFSCKNTKNDISFSDQLNLIDACILSGQFEDAVKLTDTAAENAVGLEKQLSIVKRYTKLGEMEKNKAFVEKALKKQPEVPELNAVYANMLLAEGNVLGAVKYTDRLSNTIWSPLYTEVILRRAVADNIFAEGDFTDFFERAARATHDEQWLVDAAVVEARRGNFSRSASLMPPLSSFMPGTTKTEKSAYFWALVNYDAGNYLECVDLCALDGSNPDAVLLASDAWLMAGENKVADDYWLSILDASASSRKKMTVPKEIYCNAALYAIRHNDLKNAYRILIEMVSKYPDFDDGLVVYADYALKTSGSMITENDLGISTLQQEKLREIPSIPVSDALTRMENTLALNGKEKAFSKDFRPPLYVEYLRTKWLSGNSSPIDCRKDILYALEQFRHDDKCDQYLLDFAVCWLLRNYYDDEAHELFNNYMAEKYGVGASDFAENASLFDARECMLAGWFRLDDGFVEDAAKLYEAYIYEYRCINDIVAAMNLAAIYNADEEYQKALRLYGSLAGTNNAELASEVNYRMGNIYYSAGDKNNALLCLKASVKLNGDNNRARYLLKVLEKTSQ